ncbi:Protein kinase-like domain superfamily [Arabidopsis suecica]|uniref:non-specific serine/threonine protein kinase n=1 Tax=Arabidopsis suecica TaxID=45249 RepID=A0A8T2EH70_ARASU|nr:Protein kinase-like domain superfamily [Arabidopsis suecica]
METTHRLVFLVIIAIFFITYLANAQDQQGFISIDCGMPHNESSYTEESTGINYSSDANFIRTGKRARIKNEDPEYGMEYIKPYKRLRYFPVGTRNCYNLTVSEGRHYIIRAVFIYGNYDGLEQRPKFDLHLGPNFWITINLQDEFRTLNRIWLEDGMVEEIIHMPKSNNLDICLVKTGTTTPFISALELRPLRDDAYTTKTGSLKVFFRWYFSSTDSIFGTETIVRYPDDVHDRIWAAEFDDAWTEINVTTPVNSTNAFELPQAIFSKASIPTDAGESWRRGWPMQNQDDIQLYLHFAEIQALTPNDTREFSILWDEKTIISDNYNPPEFMADTVPIRTSTKCDEVCYLELVRADSSTLPPSINAMEVFEVLQLPQSETDENDVIAFKNIQATYRLQKTSWQGDPCVPIYYMWTGLNCSINTFPSIPPRIISIDFSHYGLIGTISSDIQYLNQLEKLDLSNNNLTGRVPEFLAKMKLLTVINLSGNNLSGSIPQSLLNMQKNGLTLLVQGNPNLCVDPSCESEAGDGNNKMKLLLPIVASAASVGVITAVLLLIILFFRKKRQSKAIRPSMVANKRRFTYEEVTKLTNNFERTLGQGGFGLVYHGNLNGNEQVAVKVLSQSSPQGYKEFKAEVDLLLRVHHINLVSLVGYCDEGQHLVLIYEYMSNGNLKQHLSGECSSSPLSWENRLRIAAETAQGLEYLHIGCKPPMIHRDIKSMNILLDNHFQAKLGDFGLSRSFPVGSETHVSTNVAGSPGYLDPEYYRTNWLTEKSDVFSFGVVLLEIITSQPVIDQTREKSHIGKWVGFKLTNGDIKNIVDPSMNGDYDSSSLWKALELAMSCVSPSSSGRPNMSQVANELQECLLSENSRKGGRRDVDSKSSLEQNTSFGPEHIPDAR